MANYTEIIKIIIPNLSITDNYISYITLHNPTNLTATIDRSEINFTAAASDQRILIALTKDILLPALVLEITTENLSVDILSPKRYSYISRLLTPIPANLSPALIPTFGNITLTTNGFTVPISNYNYSNYKSAFRWVVTATAGQVSINSLGVITVTGLVLDGSSEVTVTTSRADYVSGSATIIGGSLKTAISPTFGTPTLTNNGFTVQISNYNEEYTWAGTATGGGSVFVDSTGLVTVTNVPVGTSSIATITTTRTGYISSSATVTATSLTGTALTPTLGAPTSTAGGFTVQISNYSSAYSWAGTATASGLVAISNTGLVTVTNVASLTSSTATITATRTGYTTGSAQITGKSLVGAALNPTFGTPIPTLDGFTVQITNYNSTYEWNGSVFVGGALSGTVVVSSTGLVTVTNVANKTMSTAVITTTKANTAGGTANVTATSIDICDNLITNGDFVGGRYDGWEGSNIEAYTEDGRLPLADRNYVLDLNGSAFGYIEQAMPTLIGVQYKVYYRLSANSFRKDFPIRTGTISARQTGTDGNPATYSSRSAYNTIATTDNFEFDVAKVTYPITSDYDWNWENKSFTFTATSTSTTLRFQSTSVLSGNVGPVIDKVSVYRSDCLSGSGGASSIFGNTQAAPWGIAIDSFNNIYTANVRASNVTKITPQGVVSTFGSTGTNPHGIAIDSNNNIYTVNQNSNDVTKITPQGVVSTFGATGANTNPIDIAIDSFSNIYTANTISNTVTKITPNGVSSVFGTTGSTPHGIAIDRNNNIYIANRDSNNVTKITQQGVATIFATTGSAPYSIAIDSFGNIYTANAGSNNVSKITPNGVSSIFGTTGTGPVGIAIDSFGNIYTVNNGSSNVTKITPNGVSSIFGTTGSNPYGIAIDSFGNIYIANINSNNVTKITQLV